VLKEIENYKNIINIINMMTERIIGVAKVTASNTITLLKEIRDKLKVSPGDKIIYYEKEGEIVIRSAKS